MWEVEQVLFITCINAVSMRDIRQIVVDNFNLVLMLSIIVGLFFPGLEYAPKSSAMILISAAIFFSCSRVSLDELRAVKIKPALLFYITRFVVLPFVIYWGALYFVPEYAFGVLLVALAPVGASATAVSGLCKANASLALSSTIITNALAPFVIPFVLFLIGAGSVHINIAELFVTLGGAIFLPAFLYFGIVRRFETLKLYVRSQSQFMSTMCIAGMMAAVTALEKNYIFANYGQVFLLCVLGLVLFLILYFIAWIFSMKMSFTDRKTYMVCSGVNNTGLATGLAILYFSPPIILFTIVVEIPWTIGLMVFKRYADRYS